MTESGSFARQVVRFPWEAAKLPLGLGLLAAGRVRQSIFGPRLDLDSIKEHIQRQPVDDAAIGTAAVQEGTEKENPRLKAFGAAMLVAALTRETEPEITRATIAAMLDTAPEVCFALEDSCVSAERIEKALQVLLEEVQVDGEVIPLNLRL